MKRMAWILIAVWLTGCAGTAILPAKVTYTYPLSGPSGYTSSAGAGAVAYLDNGTLELYLPLYAVDQLQLDTVGRLLPKRFVFQSVGRDGIQWAERRDPDLKARMIVKPEQARSADGTVLAQLNEGMLLVTFPSKVQYGDLAGKQLWLTSTAGSDEIFMVRGVYWKSKAAFQDLAK